MTATIQIRFFVCACLLSVGAYSHAAPSGRPELSNKDFSLRLAPRTPNQITAFYEARGFPQQAIAEVRKACFITVGLRNNSNTVVWFDMGNWQFDTPKGRLRRITREDWSAKWKQLGLAQRFQSTFRWTLSPEKLDFQPHEREGGNLTLPATDQPITISGEIYVGKQRNRLYQVKFVGIRCAQD